jgi:hypothetical protein
MGAVRLLVGDVVSRSRASVKPAPQAMHEGQAGYVDRPFRVMIGKLETSLADLHFAIRVLE